MVDESEGKPVVELDPRFKLFKFNLNTVRHFEDATGKPFEGVNLRFAGQLQIVFWAGLVDEWPKLVDEKTGMVIPAPTLVEVGRMITPANNKAILELVVTTINATEPKGAERDGMRRQRKKQGQEKKVVP